MKKYKWAIVLINLIVLLWLFNNSLLKKETLLSEGKLVLLELAPVDPRSLMQGDYMTLNYAISRNIKYDSVSKRGFCVVKLDENGIAHKVRLQANKKPINTTEYIIRYTLKQWRGINIGAESFFFQEGKGKKYEKAKYGGIKIDNKGNSLLIGLYDDELKKIQ
ncbi:GDYXXLXY domain-containing protein [Tenacibaculum ovolyticum]|uniref:GDYXXLXY domain-containing protein n=1 Tax=Tenacibaculum ovolyticum TaxID=104270 RepID=UPI00048ACB19|nr:GDYXXLXY domain-containing protein [Tenacibaculum ovolyticum]